MSDPTGEFFAELGSRGHEPMLRKATGTLRFDLVDGTNESSWTVAVKKGDVSVSQAKTKAKPDCVVTTDRPLFNAIVRGERNAFAAILRGEIRMEGDPELLVLFQRVFAGPAESIARREAVLARKSS
jgi:putative sterol carrier protein